jgi:hypothetical protein
MADPVRDLKEYGRDLAGIPVSRLPSQFENAAFLCINTYTSYRLNIGTTPINDAVLFAKRLKKFGFSIYFLHNPHARSFLKYLDAFFRNVTGQLVLFYLGHGNGSSADQAFVFDDGPIYEADLIEHLNQNKNPNSQVVFVTDACKSGTIWDIQDGSVKGRELPPGVVSISAATEDETVKQIMVDRTNHGIFTYTLVKALKEDPFVTPEALSEKMRGVLQERGQTFTAGTTVRSLLSEPAFRS